jgi:transposase
MRRQYDEECKRQTARIHQHRHTFRVEKMCQMFQVSRSGYYKWLQRPVNQKEQPCSEDSATEYFSPSEYERMCFKKAA